MYNGRKNYQTWVWHLWIYDKQQRQESTTETARNFLATSKTRDDAIYAMTQYLTEQCKNQLDALDLPAGAFADLLLHAADEIDFRELAVSFIEGAE